MFSGIVPMPNRAIGLPRGLKGWGHALAGMRKYGLAVLLMFLQKPRALPNKRPLDITNTTSQWQRLTIDSDGQIEPGST
jgi:hypothetical protein